MTSTAKNNDVTPQMAQDQMRALNGAYNAYNIQFSLANLAWTINDAWALGATDADDLAMKQALRQGTYATLDIYFQTGLPGSILGKCTLLDAAHNYMDYSADACYTVFTALQQARMASMWGMYREGK